MFAWVLATTVPVTLGAASTLRDIPFNEWAMIETHDSASGYLPGGPLHPINRWAITQPSDTKSAVTTQLNCGARTFDWRPQIAKDGSVIMHHGAIEIDHAMSDAVQEMVAWAAEHPNEDDFIHVAVSHCSGENCYGAAQQVLTEAGVTAHIVDCSTLEGMTFGQALELSQLPKGGHLLATYGCVDENYESDIACSGYEDEKGAQAFFGTTPTASVSSEGKAYYRCYTDSGNKDFPVNRMFDYLDRISQRGPSTTGRPWAMQAIWQETDASVVIGQLTGSSLLLDEKRSELNKQLAAAVNSGRFPHINLFEVNNVCDGGLELLAALRNRSQLLV